MTLTETKIAYPLNVGWKYDAFPFRIVKISGAFAVSSREATLEWLRIIYKWEVQKSTAVFMISSAKIGIYHFQVLC